MPDEDRGGRAGTGRLRDLPHRRALGGGEVLGEPADDLGEDEADDHRAEDLPALVVMVVADVEHRHEERCRRR